MSHALDAINEAVNPKAIFRQAMQIPEPPPDLVRRMVEKYERTMGRKNKWVKVHTNPQNETFLFGSFGSTKRNNVVVTMLYFDRGAGGWRELNTSMREAVNPKAVLRQIAKPWEVKPIEGTAYMVTVFNRGQDLHNMSVNCNDPFDFEHNSAKHAQELADYLNWLEGHLPWNDREGWLPDSWLRRADAKELPERYVKETGKPAFKREGKTGAYRFGRENEAEEPEKPAKPVPGLRRPINPKHVLKQARERSVPDIVKTILDYMPPDFIAAYHAGKEARYENSSVDSDWWPSYDDDDAEEGEDGEPPNPWREYSYYFEYYTENHKLFAVVHDVDKDGNHDFVDEAEVGTPDYDRLEKEYGSGAWVNAMIRYWEWVIGQNGYDPLGYVNIPRTAIKKKFVVGFVKEGERLKVWGLRNTSNPPSPPVVKWPALKTKAEQDPDWKKAVEYILIDENGYSEATEENITNDGGKWKTIGGERVLSLSFEWIDQEAAEDQTAHILQVAQDALEEMKRLASGQPRANEGD